MKVRYVENSDLASIYSWLKKHDVHLKTEPTGIGFIVPGVAACFFKCDEDMGVIDGLVTNPLVSANTRHKAIEAILKDLYMYAKYLQVKHIVAWTSNDDTLMRSLAHGFIIQPHVLMIKEI
jgi:hypothetical protein